MINYIKNLLGIEYEIDSKVFRMSLVTYPYQSGASGSYLKNITKVWATIRKGKTTVHIRTHSPGVLIGKGGVQIDEIKNLMEHFYVQPVEIDIQEEMMFYGVYE